MQHAINRLNSPAMRYVGLLLIGGVLFSLLFTPLLMADSELRQAYPAIGAIYRWVRPTEVRLTFTQELQPEGHSIIVINRDFAEMQNGPAQLDPNDAHSMVVPLSPLSHGTYTVNWKTQSVDGHPLQGSYEFTIFAREAIFTIIIAGSVFLFIGGLAYSRREREEEGGSGA